MTVDLGSRLAGLAQPVQQAIGRVVEAAVESLGNDLACIALYGSGAEKRLRASSDVNLLIVLKRFQGGEHEALRAELQTAEAAVRLDAMFVLEQELPAAAEAFASKFADIRRRHLVLYGENVLANLQVPRAAAIFRNRQILLNLILRLRHDVVMRGNHEEQLARSVADAASPLRAAAAALIELRGGKVESPRAALERFAAGLPERDWSEVLGRIVEAREKLMLQPGTAEAEILRLMALAEALRAAFAELPA
jgi:predicted nucleotidyltransferase